MYNLSLRTVPKRLLCLTLIYVIMLSLVATFTPMKVDAALPLVVAGITIAPEAIAFIGSALVAAGFTFANREQLIELIKYIANVDKPFIIELIEQYAKATAKKIGDKIIVVVSYA